MSGERIRALEKRPKKELARLNVKEELQKMANETTILKDGPSGVKASKEKTRSPFTQNVFNERVPPKIQAPQISPYYG